jgi:hypothetical protein
MVASYTRLRAKPMDRRCRPGVSEQALQVIRQWTARTTPEAVLAAIGRVTHAAVARDGART